MNQRTATPLRALAVVLAAGEGTRMRSARPKVLHEIAGRSLLAHCLGAIGDAGIDKVALVVGPNGEAVAREAPGAAAFVQRERRGTAHAVLAAEAGIAEAVEDGCNLLVAFADTPLIEAHTLRRLLAELDGGDSAVVLAAFTTKAPTGYGRLIVENGNVVAIREEKDAKADERAITLCNGGLMALRGEHALALLRAIGDTNAQNEFYLTEVVALAKRAGLRTVFVEIAEEEVLGVNDRRQLARAEHLLQQRLRHRAMDGGATLVDPQSVTLAFDTILARDVVVEPHVVFAPGVEIGEGTRIRSFSHLEGVTVGARATIGPFARLRPGTTLADDVHVGNFVEIKASQLAQGVKANHLTYIGDAVVGARTNVGAGTITCNYDGFTKARTIIGADVFIGSDSALIAPVAVGDGAYIATGSVVTHDVAADALLIARSRPVEKPQWAKDFRDSRRQAKIDGKGKG